MTNDDLIRRDDAIRIVKGAYTKSKDIDDFYALLLTAFENVLPSAQPEKSTAEEKSQLAEEKSTRKMIYLDDAIRIVESFYKVNADIRRIMAFELGQLPSANPDLSGYSDRLWERAYASGYERCRQDAIDGADEIIKRDTSGNNAVVEAMKAWKAYIGNLPSEQPERKKGEWIHKPDIYLDEQTWECSECGEPWIFIEGTPSENNANFCPNCGNYNGGKNEV